MSFFRYPGGKSKLKSTIYKEFQELASKNITEYREPFFGGGSIGIEILRKCKDINDIWINDKDIGIAALWTSVIRYPDNLKEIITAFVPSVSIFNEYKEILLTTSNILDSEIVEYGFKKLVVHQLSYSGLGLKSGGPLGGISQKSKYKIDCRWSPKYMCKKIQSLHNILSRFNIKENRCTSYDFRTLLSDDNNLSYLYLDPPYYIKGDDLYHESFSYEDHKTLSVLLRKTNHKWVLSYDDHDDIRLLYNWAKIKTINKVNYTIKNIRAKSELLITNV